MGSWFPVGVAIFFLSRAEKVIAQQKEQKDWHLQRCYQNMKLALAALSAFALVSGASALRLMTYRDYISQDRKFYLTAIPIVYPGGYGYQGARCGCSGP